MTRFEKLKEMTADEIADWLVEHTACSSCPIYDTCVGEVTLSNCHDAMMKFLNHEVPDENEVCASCAINLEGEEP